MTSPIVSFRGFVAALLLALGVAGCTSAPPKPTSVGNPQQTWLARQQLLEEVDEWSAVGRIAISSRAESWSASIRWQQKGDSYQIDLSGPFGQGAARIVGRAGLVELHAADGTVRRARSAEGLLQREIGWRVPLSGFRYWVLGRSAPELGPANERIDAYGRLEELEQAGWTTRYESYDDATLAMPNRLVVSSNGVEAKLIVKRWTLHASPRATALNQSGAKSATPDG
ncbi:MAG: lipoprotein insertase outer membrane protein LolB [Gammaproteobacteria bacterium]|nr:lipoprotein insertase outer membrane protein LolB [Gammaproteobacteria bacterium]